MKNCIIMILATALVATSFLNGCVRDNVQNNLPVSGADNTTKTLADTGILTNGATSNVHYVPGETISFAAKTRLADGTYLQTQLFLGGKPEAWWPADRLVQIKDGMWQISVQLGKNGAPSTLSKEEGYRLEIWEKGNPSHKEQPLYFDLIPPPSPHE